MSNSYTPGQFYNLDRLKAIPILEVCKKFNIEPVLRGGKYWCKVRDERTASARINLEKNSFYDFGIHEGGDVIQLVAESQGIARKDAIKTLAAAFGITPETTRNNRTSYELSDWEYKQIGLAGDLATKNFTFNLEKQSLERVQEISERYSMPMNELRTKYPKIYEKLLRDRAVPHVRDLRRDYYIALYSEFYLYKKLGAESAFFNAASRFFRENNIKELQNAEAILIRACHGTEIKAHPVGEYDPAEDIKKLLSGDLKPAVGITDYMSLKKEAEQLNTKVKYFSVDFGKYMCGSLNDFTHSASIVDGHVLVRYLECDQAKIRPILEMIKAETSKTLGDKIASAKDKQGIEDSKGGKTPINYNKER